MKRIMDWIRENRKEAVLIAVCVTICIAVAGGGIYYLRAGDIMEVEANAKESEENTGLPLADIAKRVCTEAAQTKQVAAQAESEEAAEDADTEADVPEPGTEQSDDERAAEATTAETGTDRAQKASSAKASSSGSVSQSGTSSVKGSQTTAASTASTTTTEAHIHSWTTVHHSDGHYESQPEYGWGNGHYVCTKCGMNFGTDENAAYDHGFAMMAEGDPSHSFRAEYDWVQTGTTQVWVDTSWDETVCATCGAKQ